jgi:hypothetical protein
MPSKPAGKRWRPWTIWLHMHLATSDTVANGLLPHSPEELTNLAATYDSLAGLCRDSKSFVEAEAVYRKEPASHARRILTAGGHSATPAGHAANCCSRPTTRAGRRWPSRNTSQSNRVAMRKRWSRPGFFAGLRCSLATIKRYRPPSARRSQARASTGRCMPSKPRSRIGIAMSPTSKTLRPTSRSAGEATFSSFYVSGNHESRI